MKPIYLDYAATTPVDSRVIAKMTQCLGSDGIFGNPTSNTHDYGLAAKSAVEQARLYVAEAIHAEAREIIWTSGATEANNLAIKGLLAFQQRQKPHIITAKTEHKAVLDTCKALEKEGVSVTYLTPQTSGEIRVSDIAAAITPDTLLISIMLVNNETGYVQDVKAIGLLAKQHGCFFHVDAAQAVGKIAIDVAAMQIDLLSLSAHKVYGPKGIGALYVRHKPRVKIAEQIHGGGHEHGMRSGTLATHQIVGMGEAFHLAKLEYLQNNERIKTLQEKLLQNLLQLPDVKINTDLQHSVPHILNVSFRGIDGENLFPALAPLAVSNGSACNSVSIEPSYVLQAMGVSRDLAASSIRFSLGKFTTTEEIEQAAAIVVRAITQLRLTAKGGEK